MIYTSLLYPVGNKEELYGVGNFSNIILFRIERPDMKPTR
jgi:hypothetical protein